MILERYIHREILAKLGWILGFLILILASDRFVDYLAEAAAGDLPADVILLMLSMKMLSTLPTLLPVALLLSVVLALSRLSQDRELTILSGAGLPEGFKLRALLRFSAVFSIIVFAVGFYVSPWAEGNVRELRSRAAAESDISGITAGQFRELSGGDMVVYVEELARAEDAMRNVFLQVRQDGRLGVLNSAGARFRVKPETGSRYVLFDNGSRYVGEPGDKDYRITHYRTYAVLLEQGESGFSNEGWTNTYPVSALLAGPEPHLKAELQWRASFVIATLLLPVFALAVSRHVSRDSRYLPVFVCLLAYLVYYNLLGLSRSMLEWDRIPSYVGLWWVHLGLLAVVILLLNGDRIRARWRRRGPGESATP